MVVKGLEVYEGMKTGSVGTRKSGLLKAVHFRYLPKLLEYPFNLVWIYSAGSNGLRGRDWIVFGRVFFAGVFGGWGVLKNLIGKICFLQWAKAGCIKLGM